MNPSVLLSTEDLRLIADRVGLPGIRFVEPIGRGQSASIYLLEPAGGGERIVVRRHSEWSAQHDPGVANREGILIEDLGRADIPVPQALWTGELSGRPILVTRFAPGTSQIAASNEEAQARRLAATLVAIHRVELSRHATAALSAAPQGPVDDVDDQRVRAHPSGEALLELRRRLAVTVPGERVLIHGDYHPGNILWMGERVSAVLDWEAARLGDRAADVAYCATELRLMSLDWVSDTFVRCYQDATDVPLASLPYWTATALCRSIGEIDTIVSSWDTGRPSHDADTVRRRRDGLIEAILHSPDG